MRPRPATFVRIGLMLLFEALTAAPSSGQEAKLPPAPVAVTPPLSAPAAAQPAPLAYTPPPPAPLFPAAPPTDPGPAGWGPYGPSSAPPGWFFDAELAVVFPAIKFRLTNDQPIAGMQLHVPSVPLDTTIMPTFELGYGLGDSCGYFALSYSFLFSEGNGTRDSAFGPSAVRTRLGINWLDLDYGTAAVEIWPRYEVSWRIGVRLADVHFESEAVNAIVAQTACNEFFGAGPHSRFEIERRIVTVPGLALFGRIDGAALVGRVKQNFTLLAAGIDDSLSVRRSQLVPYINVQAGLSYAPLALPGLKFTGGYLFEEYFNVGRLGADGAGQVSQSRGEVWSHGWFFRGQYDF